MASSSRLVVVLTLAAGGAASGFTVETFATEGCHERVSLRAAARTPWPGGVGAPEVTRDDEVLAANLPFSIPPATDRWGLALLVGVRHSDLEANALTDFPELAALNQAQAQALHCLREPGHDLEAGDEAALAACRAYIRDEIALAVGGAAAPDLEATEEVELGLRYQRRRVALCRYAFHLGRALHALQDGFTHTFRRPGEAAVLTVFNYVDPIYAPDFDELRDGHPHVSAMDTCSGSDAALERVRLAEDASARLLAAVAGATTAAERTSRVDAVLDEALRYAPGCDASNVWCRASLEATLVTSPQGAPRGCASTGPAPLVGAWVLGALRRRRRPR